jgi:alkanesulfonate monooxygenase SsuD/methylene tetrahydromethanopterin reductase-like flavin-dependent oxidoreductase (luciferase family)
MDFGLFAACQRFDESVTPREIFANGLETVQLADEAGFRVVWFPEHHLINFISCPSPLLFVVKAAERTRRCRVGTAIVTVPYYHPLRLAGEIGMADVLTDGRLEVGVARGAYDYEFTRFGVPTETAAAERFREGMEIVHGLLTTDDFAYQGKTWSFGPSTAVPRPIQKPHPPIWVAARSPETIRFALERGYNLMGAAQQEPFSRVEKVVTGFKKFIADVKPPRTPKIAFSRMLMVAPTDGEALAAMRPVLINHRIFLGLYRNEVTLKGGFTVPYPPEPLEDEFSPEELFEHIVAGSPDTCVEKLRMYEKLGIDHLILQAAFGTDHATTMKSLRLFAERVMPHFQGAGG